MADRNPRSYTPAVQSPRISLRPLSFRNMVLQDGSACLWEKAAHCPCTVMVRLVAGDEPQATGESNQDCSECKGTKLIYHDAQQIQAIVLGASKNPLFYQMYGDHAKGMASITLNPEHMVKSFDRITVLESVMPMTEIVERIEGDKLRLRYPIASAVLNLGASGSPTTLVATADNGTYIRYADASGVIVGSDALVEGTDYQVDDLGQIEWLTAGPAIGARLSIDYWCHPVYVCNDTPHVHRDMRVTPLTALGGFTWQRFPIQVHAWLEYFGPPGGYATTP